jgi:ligand-binding sensor domain-containing protein
LRFSVKIVALFIITILFISNTFAQQIPLYKKDVPLYIEEIEIKGTDHVFSVVEEIVQTKDGNIWLATNHGLWNYNGIDFTAYNITTHPNHFIINENSNSILEGDDSTLWVGTRNGLIMIKNNVFSRYGDSLLNESTIVRMCKDDKGNIYLGTLRRGLFRINPDKSLYKYEKPSLENNVIFSLFYSDSTLWIGTSEDGVIKLKDEKFEYLKNISPHFSYEMRDIHKDKDGNYWFGSSKNGLIKYFNNKLQHYTLKDGLSSDRIYAIAESADGSLFFGSFGGGLIKLEKNQFTSYDMNNGLSIDAVRSLYYDKEGNLWIGLLGGGLNV